MRNYSIEMIFPTPLYCAMVDNFDILLDEYRQKEFSFVGISDWGKTHKLTTTYFDDDIIAEKNMDVLAATIDKHVRNYCAEIGFKYTDYIRDSWLTSYEKGEYAHMHIHGDADISGCIYFETNGNDGNIFFETPVPSLASSHTFMHTHPRLMHEPVEGKILMFPGWLLHGVTTNETEHVRKSLAFNITFKRHSSKEEK